MAHSLLIVDDSKSDRYIVERFAQKSGHFDNITTVEDGQEAYEFFQNGSQSDEGFPPDAVILDINMPRMNGFEFLEKYEELNKEMNFKTQFVVMLTSSDHSEDKAKAEQFKEVQLYLTKPFKKAYVELIMEKLKES